MSVPAADALLAGKYRVIAAIGEGAMGIVFRAQNIVTGKHVALKWMHPHIAMNPDAATRLLREAQAASRFRHPNVVDVYDIVHENDTLFLVMELLQGETLRAYLERNRQPKITEFIAMLLPAIEGVAAAHDEGVVHRDLKPDNIFLVHASGSNRVTAKVVDFGVAKLAGSQGLTLTDTGAAIGTPMYMPLEQLRGDKDVDGRADVYAFGVMLYQAITGQMPYSASTLTELAIKVATTEPVPLKQLRPDVPSSLSRIVDWAIAKDREQRLPGARMLAKELDAFAQDFSFRQEMTNQAASLPLLAVDDRAEGDQQTQFASVHPPRPVAARVAATPRAGDAAGKDSLVARELIARGRSGKPLGRLWVVAAALAIVAALFSFLWLRRDEPAIAAPQPTKVDATALPRTAAAPIAPEPAPEELPPAAVPKVDAQPHEPRAPANSSTVPASNPSTEKSRTVKPVSARAGSERTGAKSAVRPGCNPNYFFDAQGEKHFKPQCF